MDEEQVEPSDDAFTMLDRHIADRIAAVDEPRKMIWCCKVFAPLFELATLPGGALQAVKHAVVLADVCDGLTKRTRWGSMLGQDCRVFSNIDWNLNIILTANWQSLIDPQADDGWNPLVLLDQIRTPCTAAQAPGHFTGKMYFCRSVRFLRACRVRRNAMVRVLVVVGHWFPQEIVEYIAEESYDRRKWAMLFKY
ncbi:hypothetical protein LTR56_001030 [Elasticomyces elasticus]|nr:hypothetical protein LTR22_013246 [Elasticomyces elasticus]KAK3660104.1 hypothetical protein LTR56_001030 [Elasticomyces elasticus]KAK4906986.1 hypothetical protein LTR49_023959 [Elasticomyces elasticus]KAK5747058.1 hypothetical protein LTS12_022478 [Elasticomyces elasticus]